MFEHLLDDLYRKGRANRGRDRLQLRQQIEKKGKTVLASNSSRRTRSS